MPTKGVEYVGSPSKVENQFSWAWVLYSLNLEIPEKYYSTKKNPSQIANLFVSILIKT